MEALKRHLLRRVPALIGGERGVSRGDRALICGLPAPTDIDGQLRLEGLAALLGALGLRPVLAPPPAAVAWRRLRPASVRAGIWLGAAPLAPEELVVLAPAAPLLLWPAEDGRPPRAGGLGGGVPSVLRSPPSGAEEGVGLPDPMHALWGLLDHHPPGLGVVDLRAVGNGSDAWSGRLPANRTVPLRHAAWLHRRTGLAGPLHRARARVLEGSRRVVAGGATLRVDRLGPSLLAALLGRRALIEDASTEAYWRRWGIGPAPRWHRIGAWPGTARASVVLPA